MKRMAVFGLLLAVACVLSGCENPDPRLNGTWSGEEYYFNIQGDEVNLRLDSGTGSRDGSTSATITYETKRKLIGSNEITWTENGETTSGLYKFGGSDDNKLYLSIDAASALSLQPALGPVWVLDRVTEAKTAPSAWEKLISLLGK